MKPDDPICLCFHVSRRKVLNFIRVEKPSRPSQLSQCFGAGTGCGWCRPYLERLLNENRPGDDPAATDPAAPGAPSLDQWDFEAYQEARLEYRRNLEKAGPCEDPE